MTPAELDAIETGTCIQCGGHDVECLEDCTVHKCKTCGHALTTTGDADICCYGKDGIGGK